MVVNLTHDFIANELLNFLNVVLNNRLVYSSPGGIINRDYDAQIFCLLFSVAGIGPTTSMNQG